LEPHSIRPAGVEKLVDDLVELVHLDRVDGTIDVAVPGLLDRRAERLVEALNARAQYVLETDEHR
jgi:hypothetical protein